MRNFIIIALLFTLAGCESLGTIIRDKKYSVNLHETANTKQKLGYNDDHDYVGYFVSGKFGATIHEHVHSMYCEHNTENNSQ